MNKLKNLEPLEKRVLYFIRENKLLTGKSLVAAVSGGPDSVCMLNILVRLSEELDIKLHVAHLNHCLRGEESDADAEYVYRLARKLGLPASIEERDVEGFRIRERLSPEEAAREVRYEFLAGVADAAGAQQIAAGHTSDDNVETILLHLIRGTGTKGLRGLQPLSKWRSVSSSVVIVRPILQVSRRETEDYCREHSLETRTDSTNLSLYPLRNRIRHQLLPMLESYNPRIKEALLRTARISSDELEIIENQAEEVWDTVAEIQEGAVILNRDILLPMAPAVKRLLLRRAVESIIGTLKDIESRHIEDMLEALDKPSGKRIQLPGGLLFVIEHDRCLLVTEETSLIPFPDIEGETILKIPGETILPGWLVKTEIINREDMKENQDGFTACFDASKAGNLLKVRKRRRGDRFYPLGIDSPKKLGEFMIDARIPRAWRDRVPVVCSPEQILWITGWRIDDRAKVNPSTETILRLEFKRV